MILQRNSTATLNPRAYEELFKRQNDVFYNAPRSLRKPLGIYNLSLLNIWGAFSDVLDELDLVLKEQKFRNPETNMWWDKELLRRQEDLISRIHRHFDDCLSLLCCFYPHSGNSFEEDRKSVMKQKVVKDAMSKVSQYRDHIGNMMNHMKHYQGMLRGMVVFNDNISIPGYFVEHVYIDPTTKQETLGPHPEVHSDFKGMKTAFSFNRDLRFNFWIVYAISEAVADAIIEISPSTEQMKGKTSSDEVIIHIAKRLANLPKYLFVNENMLDFPNISIEEKENEQRLILEYPSETILPSLSGNQKVFIGYAGDGITKSITLLYFPG